MKEYSYWSPFIVDDFYVPVELHDSGLKPNIPEGIKNKTKREVDRQRELYYNCSMIDYLVGGMMANTGDGKTWSPTVLLDVETPIGGSFTPVGPTFQTVGMRHIALWMDFEFNNSTFIEMCLYGKLTFDGISRRIPKVDDICDKMAVKQLCFCLKDPTYTEVIIPVEIGDLVPYVQLGFKADGLAPTATVKSIIYTMRA
jgi:hypothetical protein